MATFLHPPTAELTLPAILGALADPVRLQIIRRMAAQEGCQSCTEASPCPSIAKSTLSHHFRILREAGLITTQKQGVQHRNSLRHQDLEQRFPGLLHLILSLSQNPGPNS